MPSRALAELDRLIATGGGAVEYRFRHQKGHYIWVQDSFAVRHDTDGKPKEIVGSWADISDRKRVEIELQRLAEKVELRNRFIRETFGRYLTDEVVETVLEFPQRTANGRGQAQDHNDDGRSPRLHIAVGAISTGTGRGRSQSLSDDDGHNH